MRQRLRNRFHNEDIKFTVGEYLGAGRERFSASSQPLDFEYRRGENSFVVRHQRPVHGRQVPDALAAGKHTLPHPHRLLGFVIPIPRRYPPVLALNRNLDVHPFSLSSLYTRDTGPEVSSSTDSLSIVPTAFVQPMDFRSAFAQKPVEASSISFSNTQSSSATWSKSVSIRNRPSVTVARLPSGSGSAQASPMF